MRFLGDCLFYVKDTRNIVRYDMRQKASSLVGTTQDTVVALYVTKNRLRQVDQGEEDKQDEIDEEAGDGYTLCCLDESENVYVFKGPAKQPSRIVENVKRMGNLPQELREKDLFGMGYPYYVTLYGSAIAFSSDYGVVLLKYDMSKLA